MYLWLFYILLSSALSSATFSYTLVYPVGPYTGADIGSFETATERCMESEFSVGCLYVRPFNAYEGESLLDYQDIPLEDRVVGPDNYYLSNSWNANLLAAVYNVFGLFWNGVDRYGVAQNTCSNWTSTDVCESGNSGFQQLSQYNTSCTGVAIQALCICAGRATSAPSSTPSIAPSTPEPSAAPTTSQPTIAPSTSFPTSEPSKAPTTSAPSKAPTTSFPTQNPTRSPTVAFNMPADILVGTGASSSAQQGQSVCVNNDKTWGIVGGWGDNSNVGAVWFWKQGPDGTWTQVGSKTVAPSPTDNFGNAVALDSAATKAIIGSYVDDTNFGSVFVYGRSVDTWTFAQKIDNPSSRVGDEIKFGSSVAICNDASTIAIGAVDDSSGKGATYIYTFTGGFFTQQSRLQGTSSVSARQGYSVSLNGAGDRVAFGGYLDATNTGAAWVYSRTVTTWSLMSKLVGTGATGAAQQGISVSLSNDGLTLAVGGPADNSNAGAVWIYLFSGSWAQQGSKLVGTGATGAANQGQSVSLSSDGNILVVGGNTDNTNVGAVWLWQRVGTSWSEIKKMTASLVGTNNLGWSLSITSDGTIVFAGAKTRSPSGAAVVFQSLVTPAPASG